jgi:hypothetical protein
MKRVLIGGGLTTQEYGVVTGALTTANAATDPGLLAVGAIGIYGYVENGGVNINAANNNVSALITTATNGVGVVADADFRGAGNELVTIAQGGPVSATVIPNIQRRGVSRVMKQVYVAPVREVTFLGFNGTNGSLNLPTITQNSEAYLLAIPMEQTTPDKIREQEDYTSGYLNASESAYSILRKVAESVNLQQYATHKAEIVTNGTMADWTGTATGVRVTKGSRVVEFVINSSAGWVASTGTVANADTFGFAHANMLSVTFTAVALGTGAGRHIISIGNTVYNVADAGTDAQNATAIAAAINAGSQATATVATAAVTITLLNQTKGEKILVVSSNDDSTFSNVSLTTVVTTGEAVATTYRVVGAVSAGATFELDAPYVGENGIYFGGTSTASNAGVISSATEFGLKLTSFDPTLVYDYARQGVIEFAAITRAVNPTKGLGTGTEVVKIENGLIAYRGQLDTKDRAMKQLPRYANENLNYTSYAIQFRNTTVTTGAPHNKGENSTVILFVPNGQACIDDLDAIFKDLFTNAIFNF